MFLYQFLSFRARIKLTVNFYRSGFQISRKSLQHERSEKTKVFTDSRQNEPSMEEVMKESTSFLVAEESRQASFSSSGHYKITPLHRDTLDFETETPREARLNYIQTGAKGKCTTQNY